MNSVFTGAELARPFLPAKDFDLSKRFYETLGLKRFLTAKSLFQCRFRRFYSAKLFSARLGEQFYDAACS